METVFLVAFLFAIFVLGGIGAHIWFMLYRDYVEWRRNK